MARTEIAPTATHCPYCSLQCGMNLRPVTGGPVVEVVERTDFPVNAAPCAARAGPRRPFSPHGYG